MHVVLRVLQVSAVTITSTAAAVTEPLPARELVEHCESYSRDATSIAGRLCDSYIRGFLGYQIARNVCRKSGSNSDWNAPRRHAQQTGAVFGR
jgi:hypothetical protein